MYVHWSRLEFKVRLVQLVILEHGFVTHTTPIFIIYPPPPTHRCNVVKLVACDWLIVSGLLVKRVFVFHVVIDLRTQYWFVAGNDNNNNNIFLINVIAPTTIETKDKSLKLQTVYI